MNRLTNRNSQVKQLLYEPYLSQDGDHCLCVCVTLQRGLLIRYSSRKCLAILAVLSCWDLVPHWGSFTSKDALQAQRPTDNRYSEGWEESTVSFRSLNWAPKVQWWKVEWRHLRYFHRGLRFTSPLLGFLSSSCVNPIPSLWEAVCCCFTLTGGCLLLVNTPWSPGCV